MVILRERQQHEAHLTSLVRAIETKSLTYCTSVQVLREGRIRPAVLQPAQAAGRPGLCTLVLDEADLILSMPGYEADLQALAPQVLFTY